MSRETLRLRTRRHLKPEAIESRVAIEPLYHDFGEAEQGRSLTHDFTFKNGSRVPIEIVEIHSSCGCTSAEDLSGRVVAAGESVALPVTLKTAMDDGQRFGTITVYYREAGRTTPPMSYKDVRVVATVVPDYCVRPTLVDFGSVDDLKPVTRTIRLRPVKLAGVRITGLSCPDGPFTARPVDSPDGETDQLAEITFSGQGLWKSGPVSSTLWLDTTSPSAPRTEILVRAKFVAPVEVEPSSVVLDTGANGESKQDIRIRAARPVRIASIRCDDPTVTAVLSGGREGRELAIAVSTSTRDDRSARPANSEIKIDIVPSDGAGASEARTVSIPLHRLTTDGKD